MHQEDVVAAQLSRRDRVVRRCQRFRRCIHARHQQRRTWQLGLVDHFWGWNHRLQVPDFRGYIRPDRLSLGATIGRVRRHRHHRTGSMPQAVVAYRAAQQPPQASVFPSSHDEQARILGLFNQDMAGIPAGELQDPVQQATASNSATIASR